MYYYKLYKSGPLYKLTCIFTSLYRRVDTLVVNVLTTASIVDYKCCSEHLSHSYGCHGNCCHW